jgi:hypothetical protein
MRFSSVAETLGGLVDQLSIVNIKLFMVQEKVYRFQKMGREEYAEVPPDEAKEVWDRLAQLNLDRNRLMREIDLCFAEGVRTGQPRVDARVKLT